MKKLAISLIVISALAVFVGLFFGDQVGFALMRWNLEPDTAFAEAEPPAAPDYADETHWAALPDRDDDADVNPVGYESVEQVAAVDVFFIHPTTYYNSAHWNQPLDDPQANEFTDEQVLRNQASAFNGCCRVYAPRYRQATLFSFFDQEGEESDGSQAIRFAYEDVKTAFEYYLDNYNAGRPFIIAGHSQGGKHADTLLKEVIVGTDLESRLVAAYPVGFYIDGEGSVPVCRSAQQTGCQVTWNTLGPEAATFTDTSGSICVNPLSWRADNEHVDFNANPGAVSFADGGHVEPGVVDAQCADGVLRVSEVRSDNYAAMMFGEGNYHVYDFNLYYMSIRANARDRVAAYLSSSI